MIWWSKITAWIKAHWNWLVLVGLFILSYVLGRRSNQNYLEMANLAKDQYKKDAEAIEKAVQTKAKRDNKIDKRKEEIKQALTKERDRKLEAVLETEVNADEVFANIGIKKK